MEIRNFIIVWLFVFLIVILNGVDCDTELTVLNKCCPNGTKYDTENNQCVQTVLPISNWNDTEEFLALPKNYLLFIPPNETPIQSQLFKLRHEFPSTLKCDQSFLMETELSTRKNELPFKFTSDGLLKIDNEYYSTPEFCIISLGSEILSLRVCNSTCSGRTPCIRKCCDLNQVWNESRGRKKQKCSPSGQIHWTPNFYKDQNVKTKASKSDVQLIFPHYKISPPKSWCDTSNFKPIVLNHTKFRVTTGGNIFRRLSRYDWNTTPEDPQFNCVDGVINSKSLPPSVDNQTEYSGDDERDSILFECGPEAPSETNSQSLLYGVLMIISCVFLLLTILVYVLLWEKQSVHGWTLICYVTSLLLMFISFIFSYFAQFELGTSETVNIYCHAIGVCVHFFFIKTWCWLSMINLDLMITFNKLNPTTGKSKGLKRFLAYTIFSLTVPSAIVSVALTLDSVYGPDVENGVIVPEYGKRRCQLDKYAQLVYVYGPSGVLLAFNLLLFCITMYIMYRIQQSTKFATMSSSKRHHQRQTIGLFIKLFFVGGIPWIAEIVSWTVHWYSENWSKTFAPSWYWIAFDVVNILQSVAIFFIFVCKRDIIHSLEQKYPTFKRFAIFVMLDPETTDKIIATHPRLKGILMPFTRVVADPTSVTRNTQNKTETTFVGSFQEERSGEGSRMATRKYLNKI